MEVVAEEVAVDVVVAAASEEDLAEAVKENLLATEAVLEVAETETVLVEGVVVADVAGVEVEVVVVVEPVV